MFPAEESLSWTPVRIKAADTTATGRRGGNTQPNSLRAFCLFVFHSFTLSERRLLAPHALIILPEIGSFQFLVLPIFFPTVPRSGRPQN
ncbi:hypothetical protein DNTS_002945 [Danionella cerebrum]|uniref:Uncharacterized protein n=1 Tax=Danionella cerebrum TaxID=2873325 RepID=A0A553P9F8_9TELE|nr:hypothetical protein DNTS_002945 [Danionella translucida]